MRALLVAGGLVLALLLGMVGAVARDAALHRSQILPGVTVAGTSVGGLTVIEARERLRPVVGARLTQTLVLRAGARAWPFTHEALGLRAHLDDALATAYGLGRDANLVSRLQIRWRLRRGLDVPVSFTRNDEQIPAAVRPVAAAVGSPPQDAQLAVLEGEVVLARAGTPGLVLDTAATAERIRRALSDGASEVEAVLRVRPPRFSTEDALRISSPVGTYTTRFVNVRNRNHNIALAASRLRGRLILAGEVFSFNATVGPRTAKQGYLPAPVLINNTLVPGDGGGVCQVSSTLFNVAMLADLEVLERSNHSRPVAYLPIGRDATVVYGAQDLRFRNTTGAPLLLWSSVSELQLTIAVYGAPVTDRVVAIQTGERSVIPAPTHTVTRRDAELAADKVVIDKAKPGYRVRTYRVVTDRASVARRELIARSLYRPVPRTIRIGTKRLAEPVAPPP